MIKFKDINNNTHLAVASISRKHSVNGEKSLSGTIYSGDDVLNNLDTGWGLEFDSEPYVITYFEHHDSDNTISFDAIHKFFWDFSKKMFYRKFNGSNTIDTYLGNIFDGTGYKYALNFKPNAISKDSFGMTSKMSMFNDIITAIGAEFEVNGTLVSIYQKIGTDLSTIVRHGFNLSDMAIQNDISGLVTYAEGWGAHTNPDDENSPRLHVVYDENPLLKIYGRLDAEPIDDERYTVPENLWDALKAKVDDSLPVSISLSLYDLNKSGYPYNMAKVGDWITAVDEKINFKQKIRIISVDDEFSADGTRISYAVTAGNISSVQHYQEANASISSRINNAINSADQANQAAISAQVTADGKNTSYRVNSVDELPQNSNEGDQGWVQSGDGLVLYIYTKRPDGSFFWDKRIDPEMGQQIAEGVNNAVNQAKTYTDSVKSKVEADISQASQNANDALTKAQIDLSSGINNAKDLANNAQDTANQANTDLVQTKKDLDNTADDLVATKIDLNAKLNDKASVSYVDTANGQLNAQLVTQGKSIAAINLNSDKLSASLVNTQGDVSKLSQTANTLTAGLNDAKGNIATLQGRANSFDLTVAKVNNLKVGARNLLLNSASFGFSYGTNGSINITKQSFDNNITMLHLTSPANSGTACGIYTFPAGINGGSKYAISFDIKGTGTFYKGSWGIEGASDYKVSGSLSSDWSRISVVGTAPKTGSGVTIYFDTTNSPLDVYIKMPKIESGDISTDWSPAPEDTITDLASIHVQANRIDQTVSTQDGRITTAQQTADGAKTQVQGLNGRMTTVETTANGASALINDPQKGLNALSAKADENSATIQSTKGDVSTLQQRANGFDLTVGKVDNLSYENRNLLLDSGFESGKAHGLGTLYDSTEATASHYPQPSGKYAVVMSDNKTMPEQVWFWILDNPITIKAGQRFTISYDYAVAGDAPRASDYWFDEKGNPHEMMAHTVHDMSNQMSWKRVSFSQTLPTDITISKLRFGFQHDKPSIGWKTVDNIKIELGATATPHSYAPEDTASALASIQVKTDSITNFVKDASGNLSSEFISALLKTSLMKGVDGGSSLMSQTANSFNQAIQDNNKKVISFINLDNSGAQIKGKLLTLDGDTNVTGDFYAKGGNFKNLNASNFTTGTLDASKVRVANIDAGNITAGAINGVSLKIDLTTGSVNFARGRIKSNSENVDINIDEGYISVKNYAARATLRDGGLYLTQPNIFDTSNNPYFSLTNNGSGLTYQGAQLKGSQYIVVTTNDNSSNIFDVNLGQETFVGIAGGRDGDDWKPTKIGGASRGVIISGGKEYGGIMTSSPSIIVGSSSSQGTGSAYSGTRITLNGEYVQIPSAYNQTNSTPANLAVTYTGALVRTTSATKYKTSIHRSDSSHLGDKLLNVPMATWFDKATIRRFKEENEEQRPRVEFGMIAEDLADAGLDWLVVRDPTGEIEGIKYDRLAVALIPVIKNLKQEIEELKNERRSN
ncbi:phage tail protein [Periweissella fabaria]|uniref:Peptidase S74 domain-containing protein n=1 Tax=Periweissella fabaria TaxID=546157 RepID=A0ABM8Z3W3_9LACO|nr:phage tail protein [Periweissella fabaria]MCM0596318.1 phage tail protein [Periweissella fabaria]CAH0415972.1 hypothetical protein WFA24289_00271 [Periweissella fabaria]